MSTDEELLRNYGGSSNIIAAAAGQHSKLSPPPVEQDLFGAGLQAGGRSPAFIMNNEPPPTNARPVAPPKSGGTGAASTTDDFDELYNPSSDVYGPYGRYARSVKVDSMRLPLSTIGSTSSIGCCGASGHRHEECTYSGLLHDNTKLPHGYGTRTHQYAVAIPNDHQNHTVNQAIKVNPAAMQHHAGSAKEILVRSILTAALWVNGEPNGKGMERVSVSILHPHFVPPVVEDSHHHDGSNRAVDASGSTASCSATVICTWLYEGQWANGHRSGRGILSCVTNGNVDEVEYKASDGTKLNAINIVPGRVLHAVRGSGGNGGNPYGATGRVSVSPTTTPDPTPFTSRTASRLESQAARATSTMASAMGHHHRQTSGVASRKHPKVPLFAVEQVEVKGRGKEKRKPSVPVFSRPSGRSSSVAQEGPSSARLPTSSRSRQSVDPCAAPSAMIGGMPRRRPQSARPTAAKVVTKQPPTLDRCSPYFQGLPSARSRGGERVTPLPKGEPLRATPRTATRPSSALRGSVEVNIRSSDNRTPTPPPLTAAASSSTPFSSPLPPMIPVSSLPIGDVSALAKLALQARDASTGCGPPLFGDDDHHGPVLSSELDNVDSCTTNSASQPTNSTRRSAPLPFRIGQQVLVGVNRDEISGTVMYCGPPQHVLPRRKDGRPAATLVVGVATDAPRRTAHNGTVHGVTYFVCEDNHGLLVPADVVAARGARQPFT